MVWTWEEKLGLEGSSDPSHPGPVWRRQPGARALAEGGGGERSLSSRPGTVVITTTLPVGGLDHALPSLMFSLAATWPFHPHSADKEVKAQGDLFKFPQ